MKIFNCKIYDDNADLIGVTDFDLIYIELFYVSTLEYPSKKIHL